MPAPIRETGCIPCVAAGASSYGSTLGTHWEATDREGFWVKKLYEDAGRGESTWLMRMDPGACSPPSLLSPIRICWPTRAHTQVTRTRRARGSRQQQGMPPLRTTRGSRRRHPALPPPPRLLYRVVRVRP